MTQKMGIPVSVNVIGLVGQKNSGNDTIADYLCSHYGYTKVAFATPLKRVCEVLFDVDPRCFEDHTLKKTVIP